MELKPIKLNLDKSGSMYGSDDCQLLLNAYDRYYQTIGFNIPWVGYFVVIENRIVGSCGFTGQPKDGKVEIAYWTFKAYEGQGISSFSCRQLVLIAYKSNPTLLVTAKTAPEYNASTRILQNNGFTFSGIVQDDEIGDAWLWIHTTSNQSAL